MSVQTAMSKILTAAEAKAAIGGLSIWNRVTHSLSKNRARPAGCDQILALVISPLGGRRSAGPDHSVLR